MEARFPVLLVTVVLAGGLPRRDGISCEKMAQVNAEQQLESVMKLIITPNSESV